MLKKQILLNLDKDLYDKLMKKKDELVPMSTYIRFLLAKGLEDDEVENVSV